MSGAAVSRAVMKIAVTGIGAVTPFGEGAAALWEGLLSGVSQVRPIERFDTSGLRSHLGALVGPHDPRRVIPALSLRRLDPNSRFSVLAAAQALENARLAARERTGIVLGTNSAGIGPVAEFLGAIHAGGGAAAPPILFPYTVANAPASQCALHLGLRGPNLTIVQKEGSSCGAIVTASRIVASGGAEALVAGGADDLVPQVYEAYDRIGVLSRDGRARGGTAEGCRPFDASRNGMVLGEGACFLLLEPEPSARSRGARVLAVVEGAALGRAPVAPHGLPRDPAPLARTILRAIASAGVEPGGIDAVFASADGSPGLDAVEAAALRIAFEGAPPPATSVRGAIGESGAGGAVSAAAACFALASGLIPGTAGLVRPDHALGLDVAPSVRERPLARVLVTGFSSGGSAAALVIAAA